jgi:hypothetical protein
MAARPWLPAQRPGLAQDERGSFMVLEAILVALLVLTAILFFTSVQRPSTGTDQGGLDLAQVSADTLSILESRSFSIGTPATDQTLETWMTGAMGGDSATVLVLQDFLDEVLPTGAGYALRLDNGVSNLTVLSSSTNAVPHGARAAQLILLPAWGAYSGQLATLTVEPGQVIPSTDASLYALVDPASVAHECYQSPTGHRTSPDSDGNGADTWASRWKAAIGAKPWKDPKVDDSGTNQQVPRDLPYGIWKVYADEVAGVCAGTVTYVNVVPPGSRQITLTTTLGSSTITVNSGTLTTDDVGKVLVGSGLPAGVRLASTTTLSLPATATSALGGTTVTISPDPTFLPYSLQLVVWFGA